MKSAQFELHAEIEERHWWFVARRRILQAVIHAVVPPSRETTIVDVGCGTGANLAVLADQYDCVGIDTSSEAVRLAAGRFPQARFVCGAAYEMPSILASAQLIMLNDVLEHVPDDFRMLSELLSWAAPGTYFLLTVPADMALWSEHDQAFGHYRRYSQARLEQVWQGLPVSTLFVSHFNSRLYPIIRAVRRISQWRGKSAGRAGTDFALPSPLTNEMLTRVFAGERRKLTNLVQGGTQAPYRFGVSLMALLRREPGKVEPRRRPGYISSDTFDPVAQMPSLNAVC
ncbi:MAG: class I SAM-dependent methyltransferase [Pirellulales bacterium]